MMKIKAVLFDMDGVLIDAKDWHYEALNHALLYFKAKPISREDHLTKFDGLSTQQKLKILSREEGLDENLHDQINELKQKYTWKIGEEKIQPLPIHISAVKKLQEEGYKMAVCSNSVKKTVELFTSKAGLANYMEFLMSNEDVKNKKPDPEIYQKAIEKLGLQPEECLIVEDNINGIAAARASGAHVLEIDSILDVAIKIFAIKLIASNKMPRSIS